MSTEILHTRLFRDEFATCLSRRPVRLRLAVPYIGRTPFGSVVALCRSILSNGCQALQIVTLPPGSGQGVIGLEDAELLVALGNEVDLMIRPKLHSKIYHFAFEIGDGTSFVGSANLTAGGFERNDETVAMFRGARDNSRVSAEIDRIAGPGAFNFVHWRVREAARS